MTFSITTSAGDTFSVMATKEDDLYVLPEGSDVPLRQCGKYGRAVIFDTGKPYVLLIQIGLIGPEMVMQIHERSSKHLLTIELT